MGTNHQKSAFALQATIDRLCKSASCPTFWTFTFAERVEAGSVEARRLWDTFLRHLRRSFPGLHGVRVFELHSGGGARHGSLHVHAVFDRRLPVHEVREISKNCGMGFLDVQRVNTQEGWDYLVKYLRKQQREASLKGVRLWAPVGRSFMGDAYVRTTSVRVESCHKVIRETLQAIPEFVRLKKKWRELWDKNRSVCSWSLFVSRRLSFLTNQTYDLLFRKPRAAWSETENLCAISCELSGVASFM